MWGLGRLPFYFGSRGNSQRIAQSRKLQKCRNFSLKPPVYSKSLRMCRLFHSFPRNQADLEQKPAFSQEFSIFSGKYVKFLHNCRLLKKYRGVFRSS